MTGAFVIAWSSFAEVVVVTIVAAVVAVSLFSLGVVALGRSRPALDARSGADGRATAASNPGGILVAGICFLAVAAMVVYGLYLVIHK